MNRNKDNSNKLVVLIGILGAIFLILLTVIVSGLIRGETKKPSEARTLSYALSREKYNEITSTIYREKGNRYTESSSKDYYKYQGVGEYYKNAIMYNAMENKDEPRAQLCSQNMTEAKAKMKEFSFVADDMDRIIEEAIERAENVSDLTADGE